MRNKIKILIAVLVLAFGFAQAGAQTSKMFRVIDASGNPVTGLTGANIQFKASPYSGGYMTGLTVAEKGVQGNYLVTGFTTYQYVKLYINTVEQTWWGEQLSGDPGTTFVDQTTNESIGGTKTFTGTTYITAGVLNGNLLANSNRITSLADPVNAQDAVTRAWVLANFLGNTPITFDSMFVIRDNRIIVDSKLAVDVAGLQYNDIGTAMSWIYNNGSPGATNRWTIFVIPSENPYYTDNFTWYDYIDLIGLGMVDVNNTTHTPPYSIFTRSGAMTDKNVKAENINFHSLDANVDLQKMILTNCNIRVELDNYAPELNIHDSQCKNTGFYQIGGATIIVTGANRIIGCYGNYNILWTSSDDVMNYNYNTSGSYQY